MLYKIIFTQLSDFTLSLLTTWRTKKRPPSLPLLPVLSSGLFWLAMTLSQLINSLPAGCEMSSLLLTCHWNWHYICFKIFYRNPYPILCKKNLLISHQVCCSSCSLAWAVLSSCSHFSVVVSVFCSLADFSSSSAFTLDNSSWVFSN